MTRYIPIKQGLRLHDGSFLFLYNNVTIHSNKTRIKTNPSKHLQSFVTDHYYSTKTRIKTYVSQRIRRDVCDHYYSTKTRIKTHATFCFSCHYGLTTTIPLKQGLRPSRSSLKMVLTVETTTIPLKQGSFFNAECRIMNAELKMLNYECGMMNSECYGIE